MAARRIDVVSSGGAWSGVDEHGVFVVTAPTRARTVEILSSAGTQDRPVTLRIHGADGAVEQEQTFPTGSIGAPPQADE